MSFVHLHVHTQYSILDGAAAISNLFEKAVEDGQAALAITDHGNMYGVKEFLKVAAKDKNANVKPIVGCEVYVAKEGRKIKRGKEDQSSYHLILLAKNLKGYHNLIKLCSYAYIEGFYYKPRIDRELLEKYHEDLICSSACLAGEVPRDIFAGNIERAEETILWYKELFGDDYYLEVQRHHSEVPGASQEVYQHQQIVNEVIFDLASKHNIKVIATNDVHFVNKEDGPAHDRLICLTTNVPYSSPDRLRYTQQEYLKSQNEMAALFSDHPEVITNTMEIAEKVERYDINSKPILPYFPIPPEYEDSDVYLKHLSMEGARERYGDTIPQNIIERLDYELSVIKKMGFPDYFLIVKDFIEAVRKKGVSVGPGRGSAAGSVVAYCLKITNIDPIKYDLLFERFLNPDRISMPDIDIDFDDEHRTDAFKYVEEKYGKDHISHVVAFGTMAAKSAIKDVARIEEVPLSEANRFTKLIPDTFDIEVDDPDNKGKKIKKTVNASLKLCTEKVPEFKEALSMGDDKIKDTIKYATQLEGSIRQTGIHACALIIGRDDLTNFIPISTGTDKDTGETVWVSQYEGSHIEDVGMLKMDFLGLRTLSIIKECLSIIKQKTGTDLDLDHIPLDDPATFDLFCRGDTIGVFQFESDGMKKWLRELSPGRFEDLIAMNALYRPGPMNYIPDFVNRKHGKQEIKYDLPEMEEYLKDTYGVTVYQEQVMLLSQKIAGFTPGEADTLRKAMGKKLKDVMAKLETKFIDGAIAKGHPREKVEKIWNDWLSFAEYAFNKAHATCYAWVGYQTGYLKAHYPSEFIAANLSKNLNNMDEITKLMDDCKRKNIKVLSPDVNESMATFSVNKKGDIRFGMAGIKGVGAGAINSIIEQRNSGGEFKNIFDFMERLPLGTVNRKVLECLVYSGAFDSFSELKRSQYMLPTAKDTLFLDDLLTYSYKFQNDTMTSSNNLFGGAAEMNIVRPEIPALQEYNELEELKNEKALVGMYITSHPLDRFRFEMDNFTTTNLTDIQQLEDDILKNRSLQNREFYTAGIVTNIQLRYTKSNQPWCTFTLEDFTGNHDFRLFSKDYEKYIGYISEHTPLLIKLFSQPNLYSDKTGDGGSGSPKYSLRIRNIILLSNTKEEFIKSVYISIPLSRITPDFRKQLVAGLKKFKGKTHLFVIVHFDNEGKDDSVEFVSSTFLVDPGSGLFGWFENLGVNYGFSKKIVM